MAGTAVPDVRTSTASVGRRLFGDRRGEQRTRGSIVETGEPHVPASPASSRIGGGPSADEQDHHHDRKDPNDGDEDP